MTQIDQVAVVWQHMLRVNTGLPKIAPECSNVLFSQWFRNPLPLVFGKQCKGPRPDLHGPERGILHPACRTDMRSDIFQSNFLLNPEPGRPGPQRHREK